MTLKPIVIEYTDDIPCHVVALEYWDHSDKPWFKPGRDRPNGWCPQYFEFAFLDGQLYWHHSGSGGDYRTHTVCKCGWLKDGKLHPDPKRSKLWVAGGIRLVRWQSSRRPRVPITDRQAYRMGHQRIALPLDLSKLGGTKTTDPFAVSAEAPHGFVWCDRCDRYYVEDGDYVECGHLEWCDDCSCFVYTDTHQHEDDPDGEPCDHDSELEASQA